MTSSNDHGAAPAARPLPAIGGLALATPATEIGRSWWSRRFLELLESFGLGSRLERGREYARTGQVLELDVEPGIALAKVQGSRFTPYRVRIRPQTFSEYQWRRAEKAIGAQALTLARLLAGEMPSDVEEILAGAKLALLPVSYDQLRASCTCPDEANPCKHTAAAYYVLAERFDADPFALFTMRGRTKEELLRGLRARRAKTIAKSPVPAVARAVETANPEAALGRSATRLDAELVATPLSATPLSATPLSATPVSELLDSFWRAGPELGQLDVSPLASEFPDALVRRLGPLTPGEGRPDLCELLAPVYERLAAGAERRALSD